jgi:hypothetical protein
MGHCFAVEVVAECHPKNAVGNLIWSARTILIADAVSRGGSDEQAKLQSDLRPTVGAHPMLILGEEMRAVPTRRWRRATDPI